MSHDVKQVDGTHYTDLQARCPQCGAVIQHWDLFGRSHGLIYAATKYLARLGRKPGEQVLVGIDKAISYLQKYRAMIMADLERENTVYITMEAVRLPADSTYADHHNAESAFARANAYANSKQNEDVPTGWVLEEVHGLPGQWHYRNGQEGSRWSNSFPSRAEALATLRHMVRHQS